MVPEATLPVGVALTAGIVDVADTIYSYPFTGCTGGAVHEILTEDAVTAVNYMSIGCAHAGIASQLTSSTNILLAGTPNALNAITKFEPGAVPKFDTIF